MSNACKTGAVVRESDGVMTPDDALVEQAVDLARELLVAAQATETRTERRRRERLGRLLADAEGRELVLSLTDEVLRLDGQRLAARRFRNTVEAHPTRALGRIDHAMLLIGARVATWLPTLVMPLVDRRLKAETRGIVLPADDPALAEHIARRAAEGFELNVNPLGEAILSDAEADARFEAVLRTIGRPDVDYVSVKISAIVANLDVVAFDASVERVSERLRILYRAAAACTPRRFVNLDMEEYRDLELTLVAFMAVLGEPEFVDVDAGIVLQAYLPDSHDAAARLGAWAFDRRRRNPLGGHIKVRIVKGANLAMEHVEAELHGWSPAPYPTKADVDASYKVLLDSLLRDEWTDAIRVGVATHNLFDVAWALLVGRRHQALHRMDFEMLEGMAPAQARAVVARTHRMRMYSPVVAADDFDASIAYLARRLDENTQADNFLRALFTMTPDDAEFDDQAARFRSAVIGRQDVRTGRLRAPLPTDGAGFTNEPGTDFTDPEVRRSLAAAFAEPPTHASITRIGAHDVDEIMRSAAAAAAQRDVSVGTRRQWLRATADVMRAGRFDTLALMATETGKTVAEGDPEVGEAIDFCEYYAHEAGRLEALAADGFQVGGRGVVAVIGPWNFPYAIPTGGVAAALVAGNAVVLKPAPEAVGVGARIAEQFWAAGVPRDLLHLAVCDDGPVGRALVTDERVDTVVLTGSLATASMFHEWRPALRLLAETSGKNALTITASADLDEAIADLVRSAFGHAGQKCSAASLAIVEGSVYDGDEFLPRLRDAVRSLRIGPATDFSTMVGPVINVPTGPLERALTTLEPGERWLVEPVLLASGGDLAGRSWSPGVRIGVRPGSWFQRTECFGPVLGVVRADDLDQAIAIQNDTEFGLTGGLHSLDPTEISHWLDRVEVGNAYVNRVTTGAVVQRQPFGGWKRSGVGGGTKAGGPGYVLQLASIRDPDHVADDGDDALERARRSYAAAWSQQFTRGHDPAALRSESNMLRYVPLRSVAVRHDGSRPDALALLRTAASVAGVRLVESSAEEQSDDEFAARTPGVDRVRLLTGLDAESRGVLHRANVPIDERPPVSDGFVELYRWVREQSVSRSMHRHGRLLQRESRSLDPAGASSRTIGR